MPEDRWLHWQRELAGQTDHGVTTVRVLVLAVVAVLVALLWLPTSGASEPSGTTRAPSPCAELRRLEARGVHSGPDFWAVQPRCHARH